MGLKFCKRVWMIDHRFMDLNWDFPVFGFMDCKNTTLNVLFL